MLAVRMRWLASALLWGIVSLLISCDGRRLSDPEVSQARDELETLKHEVVGSIGRLGTLRHKLQDEIDRMKLNGTGDMNKLQHFEAIIVRLEEQAVAVSQWVDAYSATMRRPMKKAKRLEYLQRQQRQLLRMRQEMAEIMDVTESTLLQLEQEPDAAEPVAG